MRTNNSAMISLVTVGLIFFLLTTPVYAAYHFSNYRGSPPIHISGGASKTPVGISPDEIKGIYHLPKSGGRGTIAIVGAYDVAEIETDLSDFSKAFDLPLCTAGNGCFEKHTMGNGIKHDSGWAMETALDVEWAHAIAPTAKILLVEATTPSGANLLKAIDYAAKQSGVVAVSMSWGGREFPEEAALDTHFVSASGAVFIASSGDNGTGASWPAASPNVISVGGTSLQLKGDRTFSKEVAWAGSGGGVSAYEKAPVFQVDYHIAKSDHMRAIPDVSYNADPRSGFPVVHKGVWRTVGGTSAGAPQWAGIVALGSGVSNAQFYADKASERHTQYFRDIVSGNNGDCGYYCTARKRYDYVTGLGSPLTVTF